MSDHAPDCQHVTDGMPCSCEHSEACAVIRELLATLPRCRWVIGVGSRQTRRVLACDRPATRRVSGEHVRDYCDAHAASERGQINDLMGADETRRAEKYLATREPG